MENADNLRDGAKSSSVLQAEPYSNSAFMRSLFAILSLLLSLPVTRADDLPVIKDSDAIQYVGKNVEVRGFVVSVTTSPFGDRIYQFWRRIPQSKVRRVH